MARVNAYIMRPFKHKVLKRLVKEKKLEQGKLHILLAQHGVLYTQQQIKDLISGKRDQCRGDILWALCEIFGVQARVFYVENDNE